MTTAPGPTIRLVDPDGSYHRSWLEAAAEFEAAGDYQHGSGLIPDEMSDSEVKGPIHRQAAMADEATFAAFCADMRDRRRPEVARAIGLVPDTKLFIVDAETDSYLGSLSLRHELNAYLLEEGGHIGYAVRPSARRRGVATEALRQALVRAKNLGIDRVLATCEDDNVGSARTIERGGGVLEDVRAGKRRYWIDLT